MRDDLNGVAGAIQLSRRTMRIIRQNLFWAFAYNALAIPLAALGFLNPMLASAAMALSSVTVCGRWGRPSACQGERSSPGPPHGRRLAG